MKKLFAYLNFHCNPKYEPCARKGDRIYGRCENCRLYVFADRFMGRSFQKEVLGGVNKNPHILILDTVGCQYQCWFCYARDILDAANPVSSSGMEGHRFMSPEDIATCTHCKMTERYGHMTDRRPFARFRITGGEPLFSTKSTLIGLEDESLADATIGYWLDAFRHLNIAVRELTEKELVEIITYKEYKSRDRKIHSTIPTWLTNSPGKMEIRFDTNGALFSHKKNGLKYSKAFVEGVLDLHSRGESDAIRVNIDYSLKGPTPIEFEWSQARSLPVDVKKSEEPFELEEHPQYLGIKNINGLLKDAYQEDPSAEESIRVDYERGINHTDTTKYGERKLGVLYGENALDWERFENLAGIKFSEVNNPLQIIGYQPYSKYIKDQLEMGAEVSIRDTKTGEDVMHFETYPDDLVEAGEYYPKIAPALTKADKVISKAVKRAKGKDRIDVQIVFNPVKRITVSGGSAQSMIDDYGSS